MVQKALGSGSPLRGVRNDEKCLGHALAVICSEKQNPYWHDLYDRLSK